MTVENIEFESGYMVVHMDSGAPVRHDIADVLRAADIPDLNIGSMTLLTTLATIVQILVKTLVDKGILNDQFEDNYDLQYIAETLDDDLATDW